jgi:hypothetical protein
MATADSLLIYYRYCQCSGSVVFWYGSGSDSGSGSDLYKSSLNNDLFLCHLILLYLLNAPKREGNVVKTIFGNFLITFRLLPFVVIRPGPGTRSVQKFPDPDPGSQKNYGSGTGTLYTVYTLIPVLNDRLGRRTSVTSDPPRKNPKPCNGTNTNTICDTENNNNNAATPALEHNSFQSLTTSSRSSSRLRETMLMITV